MQTDLLTERTTIRGSHTGLRATALDLVIGEKTKFQAVVVF